MEKTFLTGFGAYDTKIKTGETYQNLELKDVARLTRTPSAKPKEQSQWAIFSTYRISKPGHTIGNVRPEITLPFPATSTPAITPKPKSSKPFSRFAVMSISWSIRHPDQQPRTESGGSSSPFAPMFLAVDTVKFNARYLI